jgi:hypothetical protein
MAANLRSERTRRRARCWVFRGTLAVASLVVVAAGCSRSFYRGRADAEVKELIDCNLANPGVGPLADFTIDIDPRSRMYSPYSSDWPPMPPDDATSHILMECVDGKRGARIWRRYGATPYTANPCWQQYLPLDERGQLVLDRNAAVSMALLQSPDYEQQFETLYLSALDVTFERFRFDTQFFSGSAVNYTTRGRNHPGVGRSRLEVAPFQPLNRLRAKRMFATGGELVVGLANSFVWEFAGPDDHRVSSVLDFALVQPLLRGAGRARVLERLTISERAMVANVRQMERFRRGFYVEVVTGRDAGAGPSRRGGVFGGSGLEGFTGVGAGGFGSIGGGSGGITGGAGAAGAGGFLGIIQDFQEISNLASNVAGLRASVDQLQAAHEAGRIDRFQVDLARQALYNAESRLLTNRAAYQSRLDGFKIDLGLPPNIDLRVDDPVLDQFQLLDPALNKIQRGVSALLADLRSLDEADEVNGVAVGTEQLAGEIGRGLEFGRRAQVHMQVVLIDFERLTTSLPTRRRTLRRLAQRSEASTGDIDASALDVAALDWRVKALKQDLDHIQTRTGATWAELSQLDPRSPVTPLEERVRVREQLIQLARDLSDQLFELSLLQARARLDAIVIEPVDLSSERALTIAESYRRDWMNARAGLVDRWRLVQFNANDLRGGLSLAIDGDIRNRGKNPVRFDKDAARLHAAVEFDTPLTRLAERNIYRQALIEYRQARRQYYTFVDRVNQSLRNTLRTMQLNELNFELRRQAVFVGISQVDLGRLKLLRPPKPEETTALGDSTARDLVTALSDLLNVQNDFLSVWVNYQVQRMSLDFDLGTMQLDDQCMWVDPGSALGQVDPAAGPGVALPCEVTPEFIPLPGPEEVVPVEAEPLPLPLTSPSPT